MFLTSFLSERFRIVPPQMFPVRIEDAISSTKVLIHPSENYNNRMIYFNIFYILKIHHVTFTVKCLIMIFYPLINLNAILGTVILIRILECNRDL